MSVSPVTLLRAIRVQLLIGAALITVHILSAHGIIPSPSQLSLELRDLFATAGLPIVAICAFLENIVGLNVYFPGSIVILTGMSLTSGDPARALATWFAILGPALLAHNANYIMGSYMAGTARGARGHRGRIQASSGPWPQLALFFSTFWHPHFAAVTSIACGSEKMRYSRFVLLLLLGGVPWYIFWGILMYALGSIADPGRNLTPVFAVYLVAWAAWDIRNVVRKNGRNGRVDDQRSS